MFMSISRLLGWKNVKSGIWHRHCILRLAKHLIYCFCKDGSRSGSKWTSWGTFKCMAFQAPPQTNWNSLQKDPRWSGEACPTLTRKEEQHWELLGFPGGARGKEPAGQRRRYKRYGFDPWSGRSPGGGHGNPLQYSCLENPMDRGAWRATVHKVTKSQIRLKRLSTHTRAGR